MTQARSREALAAAIRSWRRRSEAVAAERDPLMLEALAHGEMSKEDVHQLSGLGRTTLDRIVRNAQHDPETPEDEHDRR